ncbi:MAG: putative Ig domain-containing protein, partial [Parasporobacterium sp.]|nr:putative Ig domain-containing protein [Parasporobacterium sp.]
FAAQLTSSVFTKDAYDTLIYTLTAGELPAGIMMDDEGTIEGVPQEPGTYTFTVELAASNESSETEDSGDSDGESSGESFGESAGGSSGGESADQDNKVEVEFTMVVSE